LGRQPVKKLKPFYANRNKSEIRTFQRQISDLRPPAQLYNRWPNESSYAIYEKYIPLSGVHVRYMISRLRIRRVLHAQLSGPIKAMARQLTSRTKQYYICLDHRLQKPHLIIIKNNISLLCGTGKKSEISIVFK